MVQHHAGHPCQRCQSQQQVLQQLQGHVCPGCGCQKPLGAGRVQLQGKLSGQMLQWVQLQQMVEMVSVGAQPGEWGQTLKHQLCCLLLGVQQKSWDLTVLVQETADHCPFSESPTWQKWHEVIETKVHSQDTRSTALAFPLINDLCNDIVAFIKHSPCNCTQTVERILCCLDNLHDIQPKGTEQ